MFFLKSMVIRVVMPCSSEESISYLQGQRVSQAWYLFDPEDGENIFL
jgi:hypothetical protein